MDSLILLIITALAVVIGFAIGYLWRKKAAQAQANSLEAKSEKILIETKNKQQELLLEAKDKASKIIDQAKKEEEARRVELRSIQQHLEKRENMFDAKLLEFGNREQKLQQEFSAIDKIRADVEQIKQEQVQKLQTVAKLSEEQAREELFKLVEQRSKEDLASRMIKLDREGSDAFEGKARDLMTSCIQRYAASHSAETTTTSVDLPNDEMKGRIIGKEGRNIKTIEKITGCELIVDDTPQVITISGFNMIRRQIAKMALEKLIADGRIQPARIEEFIDAAKLELATDIKKVGEETVYELGMIGLDPKMIMIIGRLKYRTSYGQNVLMHCKEVGYLASMIASELGLDPVLAKKAGFFHDIGKAIDHETQGGHPELGYQILKKFNFDEEICYAALAHHEDKPKTIMCSIVKAADAISGARLGARKGTYEEYIRRLEDLEKTASAFSGIDKVYAIQAGREVRVFVKPDEIDDAGMFNLARDIAQKIEQELQYPGEIKVTMIREKRIIEYAR